MSRSTIDSLPPETRLWLAEELTKRGFCGYASVTEELKKRGFERSKMAVWRWGNKLEKDIRAAQVKRLSEAV